MCSFSAGYVSENGVAELNTKPRRVLGYLRTQEPGKYLPVARIQRHVTVNALPELISILEELEHIGQVECHRNERQIIKGARITQAGVDTWSSAVRSSDINVVAELAEIRQAIELLQEVVSDQATSKNRLYHT